MSGAVRCLSTAITTIILGSIMQGAGHIIAHTTPKSRGFPYGIYILGTFGLACVVFGALVVIGAALAAWQDAAHDLTMDNTFKLLANMYKTFKLLVIAAVVATIFGAVDWGAGVLLGTAAALVVWLIQAPPTMGATPSRTTNSAVRFLVAVAVPAITAGAIVQTVGIVTEHRSSDCPGSHPVGTMVTIGHLSLGTGLLLGTTAALIARWKRPRGVTAAHAS